MGAWIETSAYCKSALALASHPTWVRGLKPCPCTVRETSHVSHPTWVRGLKRETDDKYLGKVTVASYMGAWIETR